MKFSAFTLPWGALRFPSKLFGSTLENQESFRLPITDIFPTQPPELAHEMVMVSHFNLKRVRELVEARPSLARAAWDWGFGDWETALGAASHMGNRAIAEYLISKGAGPSLFSAAMLGHLEVVKAFVAAQPGVQRIQGPHSISLLAHAKAGAEAARPVVEYLRLLGNAEADSPVPLSTTEMAPLLGVYTFGAMNQQVEVTSDRDQIVWARKGMMGRTLFHLGERTFYPLGASSVRIRFAVSGDTVVMTVSDPEPVLTAIKKMA
jgi:hypothetical protein